MSRKERGNEKSIKQLSAMRTDERGEGISKGIEVLRRNGIEIFVRYKVPKQLRWQSDKMVIQTKLADRHQNIVMPLLAVKHKDASFEIDTEFADAGNLLIYLVKFPTAYRLNAAKSIAKQLFAGLLHFDVVHDMQHRNINPTTIFLRRDGGVKLGFFDLLNEQVVADNCDWYFNNPYVAPEYKFQPQLTMDRCINKRITSNEKADVWAVGATIVAVLLGKTLLPKVVKKNPADPNASVPTPGQAAAFTNEKNWFKIIQQAIAQPNYIEKLKVELNNNPSESLKQCIDFLIDSPKLALLLHRCLQTDPNNRISLAEASALIDVLGYGESVLDAWHTPELKSEIQPGAQQAIFFADSEIMPYLKKVNVALTANGEVTLTKHTQENQNKLTQEKQKLDEVNKLNQDIKSLTKEQQKLEQSNREHVEGENEEDLMLRRTKTKGKIFTITNEITCKLNRLETLGRELKKAAGDCGESGELSVSVIAEFLKNERMAHKNARAVESRRVDIDKKYREKFRERQELAWGFLSEGITAVREKAVAENAKEKVEAKDNKTFKIIDGNVTYDVEKKKNPNPTDGLLEYEFLHFLTGQKYYLLRVAPILELENATMIYVYENGKIENRVNANSSWPPVTPLPEAEKAVRSNSLDILKWLKIVAPNHHEAVSTNSRHQQAAGLFGAAAAAASSSSDEDKGLAPQF